MKMERLPGGNVWAKQISRAVGVAVGMLGAVQGKAVYCQDRHTEGNADLFT